MESMQQRVMQASLRFFGHLAMMDKSRLAAHIFKYRCNLADRDSAKWSWCEKMCRKLHEWGLGDIWRQRETPECWAEKWQQESARIASLHAARVEAQKLRSNPKLTLYRTLGAPMRRFWLDRAVDHPGIHLRFRLRCAGAPLMDNVGENCGVPPICRMCSSGATEDAQHFACHCDFYADLRQECLTKMRQRVAHVRAPKLREAIESGDVHLFLGDRALVELPADVRDELDMTVCNFLKLAWKRRQSRWQRMCQPNDEWHLL